MENYDFETIVKRKGTSCLKWDGMDDRFGPVPGDVLPMWVADMDFASPPQVVEAIRKRCEEGVFGYVMTPRSCLEAVSHWMASIHGWRVDPEWVSFAPGVMPALGMIIRHFSNPGDGVLIQPPIYPPFFRIAEENGRRAVLNPLRLENGRYVMDMESLASKVRQKDTRILLLCSPHNPVGRVWEQKELLGLADLCIENDVLLVSDEIHADIVYPGHAHTSVASISPEYERSIITCVSPSKTFNIPGLQTSYVIIPDAKKREKFLAARNAAVAAKHNVFGLVAAETAYRDCNRWREEMIRYVRGNLDRALAFFGEKMPWVKPCVPEGTYLLWLDFNESGLSSQTITENLLLGGKVALDPGHWFGEEGAGWQRLNLACPRELLEDGLERIRGSF